MNIIKNPLVAFILGVVLVLGLGVYSMNCADTLPAIGGTTNFNDLAVDSITVSGTATIGTVSGAAVSGTTGVFSSTLSVTGATTLGDLTTNGGVLATSTSATAATMVASDLQYGLIEVTVNVADLTYTLPATSTLTSFIPTAGDTRTITIHNATSTAGIDVIFAAGTGMVLKAVGTPTALSLDENSVATLTFVRESNSDILVLMATPLDD